MGSAMFATAAFQRYARAESISFYPLYSIQFMPPNLPAEAASLRRELVETYRPHDAKICTSWFTTICGVLTTCDLMAIYKPFWPRSYTVDTLRGKDVQIRSPSGQCLDAKSASEVTLAPCDGQRGAQRWNLERGGVIRSSAHARCLIAAGLDHGAASQASQSLGLAGCARVPAQQFYLTSQGQLRGPEATCVREERTRGLLEECAPGTSQRSWQAR
jgi:hypothetical protein